MSGIRIVTDSTADLPTEIVEEYGITVVPLKVFFGQEEYSDGVDLTSDQFFRKLKASDEISATSQPAPAEFVEYYRPLVEEGASIISIHISSELSGTLQSAKVAKKMLDYNDLEIINSRVASVPLGMMSVAAARAARAGKSKEEVVNIIHKIKENQWTFFVVDTLEYLKRGGRIGKATAFLGSLLNIKPLLYLKEGMVYPGEKVRGRNKAFKKVVEAFQKEMGDQELWGYIAYGDNSAGVEKLREEINKKLNCREIWENQLGPVIGTHVGPGIFGFCACRTSALE